MSLRCLPALIVACLAPAAWAQPGDFFLFPSGSRAFGVTSDGSTVVGAISPSGSSWQAFRWTAASGVQVIGAGMAKFISDDGSVISGISGTANTTTFRWTSATGMQTLGTGDVQGMSRTGARVTGVAGNGAEGFQWSAASGYQTLPHLPGAARTYGWNISGDGSTIVGSETIQPNGALAARWTAAGPSSLGLLPGGVADAAATCVSDDGSVIFGMAHGPNGYDTFRWTQQTGMVGLGVVAADFSAPLPIDCTPDGGIIVGNAGTRAFVWRLGSGPEDVQTVLEERYHLNLGNLVLERVSGISDDGRTIIGNGRDGSVPYGFVATLPWSIPSPSSATILVGAALIARRRRFSPI